MSLPSVTSAWSGAHGHLPAWSTPHLPALGTQPRDNGAIHSAWPLHSDPLGLSPWPDSVCMPVHARERETQLRTRPRTGDQGLICKNTLLTSVSTLLSTYRVRGSVLGSCVVLTTGL